VEVKNLKHFASTESHEDTVTILLVDYICRMCEKRKYEDDVDIYGDLPNFQCVNTRKRVSIMRDIHMYAMYRISATRAVHYYLNN
jgi:hypothetical protein